MCFHLAECMYLIMRDGGEHTAGAFRRALRGWRDDWRVTFALVEDLSCVPVVFSESSSVLYSSSGSTHSMFTYPHVYTIKKKTK